MKAILMTQPGPREVLQFADIAEPEINTPNQIKVQLKAAGINPIGHQASSARSILRKCSAGGIGL